MSGDDWTVDDIAGVLQDHKGKLRQCCLLIGAGVSLTAGVSTGPEFVKLIRERHPKAYARAECKAGSDLPTYNGCMSELTEFERAALVRQQIEAAHINWAHIGIGRLEAAGCVDRILTSNFDPLASRACALFNRFPAVYDLAALRDAPGGAKHARFIPSFVSGSAIYHLHGQHTGFLLLNTEELLERQAQRIEPALQEAASGRTLIICGYSGENDPLVERLARQGGFPHGLIWVRHDEADPCDAVTTKLLSCFDDCHIVRNKPADLFFTELADALQLDQPAFLTRPFKHLDVVLERIRPFSDVSLGSVDLLEQARTLLRDAQQQSRIKSPDQNVIAELMAQRRYQEIFDRFGKEPEKRSESEQDLIAWALIMLGNAANKEVARGGPAADKCFAEAVEKYAAALALVPDRHEALYNWGNVLASRARTQHGEAADVLFAQAQEKYAAALAIKPDKQQALFNWGATLSDQASTKQGKAADVLFDAAVEKYAAALAIEPQDYEALANLGGVFADQAKIKKGKRAEALFAAANEKYAAAYAIQPNESVILANWAEVLLSEARSKHGEFKEALLRDAQEKCEIAEAIQPGSGSYNLACIFALRGDAESASRFLRQGKEKSVDFPGCDHILQDSDFDRIRRTGAFKAALSAIGCALAEP
jgi:tetratricopeptide (TPR) repeat protein